MKNVKTDTRLHNVKIEYGKINIEHKKFILPILELLQECNASLIEKKRGKRNKIN